MQIAVISDLHLGRGDLADRGRRHDADLLRLLDYLESRYDRIILLGDIWELLTSTCPGLQRREVERVREAHPEVARRFAGERYHYIPGNHDHFLGTLEGHPQEWVLSSDRLKIIFTHGHQFDIWANRLRYVSEFVVWLSGWAARLGTRSLIRFFDWFHNLITGTSTADQLGALESKLIERSQSRGAQMTVIGHTHAPGISEDRGHLLANSGYGLNGTFHFVSISTREAKVAVYRVPYLDETAQSEPLTTADLEVIATAKIGGPSATHPTDP